MKKIFIATSLLVAGHAFSGGSTGGFPGLVAEQLTVGREEFEKLAMDSITNDRFVYKGRAMKPDTIRLNDQIKAMSFRAVDNPEQIIVIQQGASDEVKSTVEGGSLGGGGFSR
jgi:hypothetical protein